MKRTPLKRYTPLKAKRGLKKMSIKALSELDIWLSVKEARMLALEEKFGYVPCEHCKLPTNEASELNRAEGHHNDHNRRHNYPSNCRIVRRVCNQLIEDLNIKDVPSLL